MNSAHTTIDISNKPELLRLAEEVRTSGKPRLLKNQREIVAVLMPADTVRPGRSGPTGSVVSSWPSGLMIMLRSIGCPGDLAIGFVCVTSVGTCHPTPLQFLKLLQDRYQFINKRPWNSNRVRLLLL